MENVPPKISPRGNFPASLTAIFLMLGALIVAATVFVFDPAKNFFYPGCTFHKITGLNCPGCGATRSLHALLHGNVRAALQDNAMFIALLILFTLRGGWLVLKHFRGRERSQFFPVKWLWPLLTLAVLFSVLRNLPAFSFLSP